jgi:hypothetical protein
MTVELQKIGTVAGVDHVPVSRQNASCHCRKTINKNEEDSGDDHAGGGCEGDG